MILGPNGQLKMGTPQFSTNLWKNCKVLRKEVVKGCLDLEHAQRSTPDFQAKMIPKSTKMKCSTILKYLQWMSMTVWGIDFDLFPKQ